jgi:hypothetical protein
MPPKALGCDESAWLLLGLGVFVKFDVIQSDAEIDKLECWTESNIAAPGQWRGSYQRARGVSHFLRLLSL